MKIIIVGAGKIGTVIAEKLCREGHDITVIDNREDRVNQIGERFDIMTIQGNGSTYEVLTEAGVDTANLLIAATPSDELNLLCCLIAKKLGARHTIARVGNSEFNREIQLIKKDLGLSMAFNPEMATAVEMTRILRVPAAVKIDTFAKGRVELLKVRVATDSALDGISLVELGTKETKLLVCAVERGENEVYIPSGNFRLQAGDLISVIAKPKDAYALKFTFKEKRDFETIEDTIAALEEKLESLEKEIDRNSSNYSRVTELMAEQEKTQTELEQAMERWMYLQEKLEKIEANGGHL